MSSYGKNCRRICPVCGHVDHDSGLRILAVYHGHDVDFNYGTCSCPVCDAIWDERISHAYDLARVSNIRNL